MLSLWSVRMVCVWITVTGGYVLFNRNLNVLGNGEYARLEELPLEEFDVDEIPLEGEIIKEHAGFTDVFFYSDCTNPYAGYVLDLKKLKVYNQFIYPLAMILNRKAVNPDMS